MEGSVLMRKSIDKVEILGIFFIFFEKEMREFNFCFYEKCVVIFFWVWVFLVIVFVLFLVGFIIFMVVVIKKFFCEGGKVDGDKGNVGSDVSMFLVCKFLVEVD